MMRYRLKLDIGICEFLDDAGLVVTKVGMSRIHPGNETMLRAYLQFNARRAMTRGEKLQCEDQAKEAYATLRMLHER